MSQKIFQNEFDTQIFVCNAIAQRILDSLSLVNMKEEEYEYHFINYDQMMLRIDSQHFYVNVNLKTLMFEKISF